MIKYNTSFTNTHKNNLRKLIETNEEWLMGRILDYAIKQKYAGYTSTLKEAWRLSISGLTETIIKGLSSFSDIPEMTPDDNFTDDPVAFFGIIEAQKHRERGISLKMFLGLMKYYRQSYLDLVREHVPDVETYLTYDLFLHRIFDRIEIGFCDEWSEESEDNRIHELQSNNRMMTNEKNKYLTIFESIPNPIIMVNREGKIDNMNLEATRLFIDDLSAGSQYYCFSRDRHMENEQRRQDIKQNIKHDNKKEIVSVCYNGFTLSALLPWLADELAIFLEDTSASTMFEKMIRHNEKPLIFRVKLTKSLDISGKFDETIIILEDITSLKKARAEIKSLQGFLPICAHCKNIRDDEGYWQKVEKYVTENSDTQFSHGICPECARKYYSEYNLYDE